MLSHPRFPLPVSDTDANQRHLNTFDPMKRDSKMSQRVSATGFIDSLVACWMRSTVVTVGS